MHGRWRSFQQPSAATTASRTLRRRCRMRLELCSVHFVGYRRSLGYTIYILQSIDYNQVVSCVRAHKKPRGNASRRNQHRGKCVRAKRRRTPKNARPPAARPMRTMRTQIYCNRVRVNSRGATHVSLRPCVRACSGIRLAVSACVTCWFLAIRMSLSKRSGAEGCVYLLVFANEQLGVQILSTIRVFLWQRLDWRIEMDLLSKLGKFSIRLVHFCLHKQFV